MADHELILERIAELKADVGEVLAQAKETNGRLRKAETNIAVLRWAVFGGGSLMLGVLGYIIRMHLQ